MVVVKVVKMTGLVVVVNLVKMMGLVDMVKVLKVRGLVVVVNVVKKVDFVVPVKMKNDGLGDCGQLCESGEYICCAQYDESDGLRGCGQ